MSIKPKILIIGTYDTKTEELVYLYNEIKSLDADVVRLDVSVLGEPGCPVEVSKHDVAAADNNSIDSLISLNDENESMIVMAKGASALTRKLYDQGEINGLIALGGTMGTDLALDCASALPVGVPKYIVSTVSFSSIIEPARIPADAQMILWAGGLYGLNELCKSTISQAAGAIVGSTRNMKKPGTDKPIIGITSLGMSCLKYIATLYPALQERGYEVAIFHTTGMGGRAFESLASQGVFSAVFDFSLQELGNLILGSSINAGKSRLLGAGSAGTPQIVAPGAMDIVDLPAWQEAPSKLSGRSFHPHNRLITSAAMSTQERQLCAQVVGERLGKAKAPVHFILPNKGIEEWDKEGGDAYNPEGLTAFVDEMRKSIVAPVELTEVDAHINDPEFCETALQIFDKWVEQGIIKSPA